MRQTSALTVQPAGQLRGRTYIAVYEQDDVYDAWNAYVEGVEGCIAQARNLPSAQARIREALGWRLRVDSDALLLEDRMPPQIASVAKRANRARREADRAARRAQLEVVKAARGLAALGLSRRDAAAVLNLSHQRVQQLITGN